MKAVLTALLLAAALAAPAAAQDRPDRGYEIARQDRSDEGRGRWGSQDVLPEQRVDRIVYRQGYVEIERVRLQRGLYLVEAVRPNGAVFRLALDAYDGRLVWRERIGWSRMQDPRDYGRRRSHVEFRLNLGG